DGDHVGQDDAEPDGVPLVDPHDRHEQRHEDQEDRDAVEHHAHHQQHHDDHREGAHFADAAGGHEVHQRVDQAQGVDGVGEDARERDHDQDDARDLGGGG